MYRVKISVVLIGLIFSMNIASQTEIKYKNPKLSTEVRVQDLLSRMTLEEKVGQLLCPMGWEMYERNGNNITTSALFRQQIDAQKTGMFWAVFRADPWTKKTLDNGLNPELAAKTANTLQEYAVNHTRLGIPLFFAEEAPHGHMAIGTTVFPTGIGLASTWSEKTMHEVGEVIATEIRRQGAHIGYGPVVDLVRDPRWSRVEETFGEDPVLSGTMAAALVRGMGGRNIKENNSIISTPKHFIAYGIPESGQNGAQTSIGLRELSANFLPPFHKLVDAGALSIMTSYNSTDGIPCTSNKYLLTDVLKKEWNFNGFVVSDLYAIDVIHNTHKAAASIEDAAIRSITAGTDVDLGANAYQHLIKAVQSNKIQEHVIDSAVARVLRLKFEMKLFENPYVNVNEAKKNVGTKENAEVALQAARESIILLKNRNSILPLSPGLKIAVIGPNADNIYNQLGDYTAPQDPKRIITILKGLNDFIGEKNLRYVKGCSVRDTMNTQFDEAKEAARQSDVVIMVMGGSSARDFKTSYKETGAAEVNANVISDMEAGEGYDRATLSLMGKQMELLKEVHSTGKPMIVIYISGRPLDMNWADENADALLMAWYPGQEGGRAVAEVLFGNYNPAGRLPVSVPRNVGQIPVYYNKNRPKAHDYIEMPSTPLFPFGFGMSYTKFLYSNLTVKQIGNEEYEISFLLKNIGQYDGDEVVQLYLNDEYSSVVRPEMELKKFTRIYLKTNEEKEIHFTLKSDDFMLVNEDMKRVAEKGIFNVLIGTSSDNIRLKDKIVIE